MWSLPAWMADAVDGLKPDEADRDRWAQCPTGAGSGQLLPLNRCGGWR